MSSSKLFLEWNDLNGQYVVVDKDKFPFGNSYEPTDAIKHARMVTDEPISMGEGVGDIEGVIVHEKPTGAIADAEVFISALAEIGGMTVTKYYDDQMNFIGYGMEVKE